MKKITRIAAVAAAALMTLGVQAAPHHPAPPRAEHHTGGWADRVIRLFVGDPAPPPQPHRPAPRPEVRHQAPPAPHHHR